MSVETNRATVERFFEAINRRDVNGLDDICAPDFTLHFPGVPAPLSREGAKQFFGMFFAAFPDIHHSLEDVLTDGHKVAIRMTIRGTQQGEFQGLPVSGKPINIGSLNIFYVVEGKITEQWVETDTLGMLQQLGAVPAVQPVTAQG
jgi:steroid delta-isomerase-like uncharacterized protein